MDLESYEHMWTSEKDDWCVIAPNGLDDFCEYYQLSTGAGGFTSNSQIMREIIRRMVAGGARVVRSTGEVPLPTSPLPEPPLMTPEELLRDAPPFDLERWRAQRYRSE